MELIKISKDKEKAKSILKMQNREKMAALIISDYYEIIKELITAILLLDGYKTLSHKDLIDYIKERHREFNQNEIYILDDLRILRNRIAYEGFFVEYSHLNRNENSFKEVIQKLKSVIENKLG